MPKTKVLITVKTYPTLSTTYQELVCTAGFTEDGKWVRIYPVPFRRLEYEQQYKKYDWIELELVKSSKDIRPESYRPADPEQISIIGNLPPDGDIWEARRNICLNKVYHSLSELIDEARNRDIST